MMKTASGFEFEIEDGVLDNMELLDAIAELEENPLKLTKVVKLLLGEETKERLYDHVRNDKGRVPAEALSTEVADIFKLLNDKVKK